MMGNIHGENWDSISGMSRSQAKKKDPQVLKMAVKYMKGNAEPVAATSDIPKACRFPISGLNIHALPAPRRQVCGTELTITIVQPVNQDTSSKSWEARHRELTVARDLNWATGAESARDLMGLLGTKWLKAFAKLVMLRQRYALSHSHTMTLQPYFAILGSSSATGCYLALDECRRTTPTAASATTR
ncbi:hypothetical protein IF1G_03091 [Cordyceps javanica]|uniref:Uncharacterized protein n=1 Tax=Cordyceps javanica TaxID=43265 RepID=A0A545VBA6_9HYPO|nr:hypothetical protein IF1G_03091 [Cordyceps javanica]